MSQIIHHTRELFSSISHVLRNQFDLSDDGSNEREVIDSIKSGLSLRGTNLWILIFAILIASVGLNVNSTAVVIGAMLISPLMGPIMAIGVGAAIQDFGLIRGSVKSLLIAVCAALLASSAYFMLSPLNEAHSELLARTVPTIYDVFIAFFGGLAGMIAFTRRKKSTNVIAGVAIATALMPPLCTAGYGLANLSPRFFFGAFYLFTINSIYIFLATYLVARFLKFRKVSKLENVMERRLQHVITTLALITMLPSVFIAYRLVQEEITNRNVSQFIEREFGAANLHVLQQKIEVANGKKQLKVVVLKNNTKELTPYLQNKLGEYGLNDIELVIDDSSTGEKLPDLEDIKAGVLEEIVRSNERLLQTKNQEIAEMKAKLEQFASSQLPRDDLLAELQVLNPDIQRINLLSSPTQTTSTDKFDLLGYIESKAPLTEEDRSKIRNWLKLRTKTSDVYLLFKDNTTNPLGQG